MYPLSRITREGAHIISALKLYLRLSFRFFPGGDGLLDYAPHFCPGGDCLLRDAPHFCPGGAGPLRDAPHFYPGRAGPSNPASAGQTALILPDRI